MLLLLLLLLLRQALLHRRGLLGHLTRKGVASLIHRRANHTLERRLLVIPWLAEATARVERPDGLEIGLLAGQRARAWTAAASAGEGGQVDLVAIIAAVGAAAKTSVGRATTHLRRPTREGRHGASSQPSGRTLPAAG